MLRLSGGSAEGWIILSERRKRKTIKTSKR
jgi:hypothetical protein